MTSQVAVKTKLLCKFTIADIIRQGQINLYAKTDDLHSMSKYNLLSVMVSNKFRLSNYHNQLFKTKLVL